MQRVIGIDLGGTRTRVALIEGTRILSRAAAPTNVSGGPAAILDQFETMIATVSNGEDRTGLAGIGISSAGPIDTEAGIVLGIPTLPGWTDFPICSVLSRRTGLRVVIENDAIAAALGEWRHGAGRGLRHMAYLTVSTGIGGGVVVDGRVIHGRKGMAAHVGHMRLAEDGPRCSCGATACFEALASGTALGERARAAAQASPSGYLGQASGRDTLNASHVVEGARAGDRQCLALVDEEARYLGQGITTMIHLFSPERVVMGGGLAQAFDLLEPGIHDIIQTDALPPFRNVRVVRAELGDNSGLIGAAAMVLEICGF